MQFLWAFLVGGALCLIGQVLIDRTSLVLIDFELAAQRIQTAIYGDSNITLADDRVIPFQLVTLR